MVYFQYCCKSIKPLRPKYDNIVPKAMSIRSWSPSASTTISVKEKEFNNVIIVWTMTTNYIDAGLIKIIFKGL